MGSPKCWLKIRDATFLLEIANLYNSNGVKNIVIVLNEKFTGLSWDKEVIEVEKIAFLIKNNSPEKGRLYSLQLGLKAIKSDFVFIHNVDNPFVDNVVLKNLIEHNKLKEIIIPTFNNKGGHPVIINRTIQNEIIENYDSYKTLKEIFSNYSKEYIEVDSKSILKNINTPQELEQMKYELA